METLLHENMIWHDANSIDKYAENTKANREKPAKTTAKIILAATQYMYNYIQGLKRLSAYDAASILCSDINWFKNSDRNVPQKWKDDNDNINVRIGKIYYINYGNTFKGELSYFHYGLCIGKKDKKILIIPMRTGADIFKNCYHPRINEKGNKKYRRCYKEEGFQKECVLLINDTKYLSCGRIIKEAGEISNDILKEIQMQAFAFQYPDIYQQFVNQEKKLSKLSHEYENKKDEIVELKNKVNNLTQNIEVLVDNSSKK